MNEFFHIFRVFTTYFCITSLVLIASAAIIALLARQWRAFRVHVGDFGLCTLAVVLILYGGTKPSTTPVAWDEYFADKSYLIDTNDLHRISFAWTSPAWMPAEAKAVLHAFRRAATVPELPDDVITNAPMSAGAMTAVMPYEATNYAFFVECDWTPSPAIVTNGVYHVRAVENAEKVVPIGVSVKLPNQEESQE